MNKEPLGREIISVNRAIFVLFISAALLFSACQQTAEQSTQATLKPLEAFRQVEEEIRKRGDELKFENDTDYFKHFARFAEEIMDQVQTENLEPEEIVWLGTFYEFCGKYQEGLAALDQIKGGNDIPARDANRGIISIHLRKGDLQMAEQLLDDYRKRFPPIPEHTFHLGFEIRLLVDALVKEENYDRAADLLVTELKSLPLDAPYVSISDFGYNDEIFVKAGRKDEFLSLTKEYGGKLSAIAAERAGKTPEAEEEKQNYERATLGFQRVANTMNAAYNRLTFVGKPAPRIDFTNFINIENTDLEALKGNVVLLDFWATWCKPCIKAFPKMRELNEKYGNQDFVMLGVTSFQGSFSDGDIRERNIDHDREIELTEGFVERHEMTWPVVFSKQSCFNPDYGVSGIPTLVLIDKKGIVRLQITGVTDENEEKIVTMLETLLSE